MRPVDFHLTVMKD